MFRVYVSFWKHRVLEIFIQKINIILSAAEPFENDHRIVPKDYADMIHLNIYFPAAIKGNRGEDFP